MIHRAIVALAIALAASCGPLVEGGTQDVLSGHVTEVLEVGDRTPVGSGMPQPFQRGQMSAKPSRL